MRTMASPQILVEVNLVVGDYSPAFTVSDGGPESRLLSLRAPVPSVTQVLRCVYIIYCVDVTIWPCRSATLAPHYVLQ